MRFRSGLLFLLFFATTFYSCRTKGGKNLNQGEIHYNIEYSGNMGMPREIMPRNLVVSFKDDKILFDISGPIGNTGILNLSNPEEGIYDTYISLLTWRFYYAAEPGEEHPGFEAMKGLQIRKTGKSAVICGFNCKNAEVTVPSREGKVYQVWYTNEIEVRNPNAATPFSALDGVLMDFFFILGPAEMHFTAETVYKKDISDQLFERRTKYIRKSREEITSFINKMIAL